MEQQEGSYLYHTECLSCDSSDGLAIYHWADVAAARRDAEKVLRAANSYDPHKDTK